MASTPFKGYSAYKGALAAWVLSGFPLALFDLFQEFPWRLAWIAATATLASVSVALRILRYDEKWSVPLRYWVAHWMAMALVVAGVINLHTGPPGHYQGLEMLLRAVVLMGLGALLLGLSLAAEFLRRRISSRRRD